jgi:hypothetical protein
VAPRGKRWRERLELTGDSNPVPGWHDAAQRIEWLLEFRSLLGCTGGRIVVLMLEQIVGETKITPYRTALVAVDFSLDVGLFGRPRFGT